jgi:hypothetical protein
MPYPEADAAKFAPYIDTIEPGTTGADGSGDPAAFTIPLLKITGVDWLVPAPVCAREAIVIATPSTAKPNGFRQIIQRTLLSSSGLEKG